MQGSWRSCDNLPGTSCKLLAEDFTTYHERVASHLKKMRWYNVSGASGKLLEAQFTTYQEDRASYLQVRRCCKYQERLACYLAKMLQQIRNIFQVTSRKVYNVSGRSCKLMTSRKMLQVSGTSCMLLDEDVTTYKEHLSSFLKKMWQRARKVLQVTCWTFHSVSGTCCKSLEEDVTTY